MCCVCVPSSVLKVQLIYSEPFFQPSSLFLPVVSTNRCFGKSRFSLLAYLSVYPLIYILQYIAYTLHTVYIHYTATCLHTHQSSMSAYEKNLQKIAICPHSLELSAVYIRLHNAVRQLQAGSPCHQQAICQAGLYDCMYCQNRYGMHHHHHVGNVLQIQ